MPTVATPLQRQEFPGFGTPVDRSIDGVTEALGAQPVGLGAPEDEGPEVSAIDSLFGDSNFVEYEDAVIPALPPRASGGELVVADRSPAVAIERVPLTPTQRILLWVAGGLVALLLLIVLFLAGNRLAQNAPAPAVVDDPTPTAPAAPPTGPLPAGEYRWDQLRGGECITPFVSAWEDSFTVVPCTEPHQAQLALKSQFPATENPAYPGVDALQNLVAALCSAPTVIDYAAVGGASDIQISGSFAPDEQAWLDGDRGFSCFVSRAAGAGFTAPIALPQPAS